MRKDQTSRSQNLDLSKDETKPEGLSEHRHFHQREADDNK